MLYEHRCQINIIGSEGWIVVWVQEVDVFYESVKVRKGDN